MSEHKNHNNKHNTFQNSKLKIKKLYHMILATGLTPLVLVIGSFILWLTIDDKSSVNMLMLGVMIFSSGLILINAFFLFVYYGLAKKQRNTQALSRTITLIGLLLFNLILSLIFYNYMNYAQTTHTIVIDNRAQNLVKKMFLTQSAEKYFIAPIEAHDKLNRALQFKSTNEVTYTFDLKGQTYTGVLFDDVIATRGKQVKMIIYREGMVTVNVK